MTEKLEPLQPITATEQAEFERRRESQAVVQNKCPGCSAWYETGKRSQPFTEAFFCDCGTWLHFEVPALSGGALLSAGAPIDYSDPDARLDTGMKVGEAIDRARNWWNAKGRHQMRKDGAKGSEAAASLDPDSENYIPSGIINGEPWDQLDNRERARIVKIWHHFNIRKPQTIGD